MRADKWQVKFIPEKTIQFSHKNKPDEKPSIEMKQAQIQEGYTNTVDNRS